MILNAPAETVWQYITHPSNFPEYVYGYKNGETVTAHEIGVGASYEWYGGVGPLKARSTEAVVEWVDNQRVAYKGTMVKTPFSSTVTLARIDGGKTALSVNIDYRVPRYLGGSITDALIVRRLVREYVNRSLDKLTRKFS